MRVKTTVKAGGTQMNHNETLARVKNAKKAKGTKKVQAIVVKTTIKAGGRYLNHNETLVRL